ncbi:E3 ubiquitin ligase BIG BROTHER-related-like isoform X1 [Triticum urartu]|uniref:E3 ubiquitin ligase BIG BROTHER-related-like isoform X1 n=1 Tax=Triticum urartu TaxID=4572 RepID=UPI002042E1D4|nr:E3 ubiquitin ligase BIG BROTHER-related-like isoform X1 [Triticum urartu]
MSMEVLHDTTGKKEAVVYYMDTPLPYAIEENFGGCFFEDDVDLAQVLQDQEIVYQLIQGNDGSGSSRTHSDPSSSCGHPRKSSGRRLTRGANYESQLAVDEALARDLQAMEDQIARATIDDKKRKEDTCLGRKPVSSSTSNNGNTSVSRSSQVLTEDGVDPDNMTYEELQQLGETIGTESKGLPEDVIALLKSSTYKIGIFSRKEKHDECVICCMAYKNRDKLTTLPCQHQYHRTCVAKWLKINKVCPVCNKEVFGS